MGQQKKRNNDNKDNSERRLRWRKKLKLALLIIVILFLLAAIAGAVFAYSIIKKAPPFDLSKLETMVNSYMYDRNGEVITELYGEQNRVILSLDEIPDHVQKAFLSIEDERFESHFGVDIIGWIRAAAANLKAGTIVQGGSTITQQLAKDAFLSPKQTIERKIQEAWLAIQIERHLSKEAILEHYLNRIYFGNGAYGVEAAAQTYFNKGASDLSVAEAALLAGIIRAPDEYYNPFSSDESKERAENRAKLVLQNMLRLGFISEAEYQEAINTELAYGTAHSIEYPFPHFVDYVLHYELVDILSAMPQYASKMDVYNAIYTGGLHIYTTMDRKCQSCVEEVLNRKDLYPETVYVNITAVREELEKLPENRTISRSALEKYIDEEKGIPQPQAAIVLTDPTTGEILALGGGREYSKKRNEIVRFTSRRPPGSAIKPLVTYGPAFEEGVLAGASAVLDDSPYVKGSWTPENFDFLFRGLIPVREALFYSYNVPAVRAFEMLGPRIGTAYAQRMGISTFEPEEVENLSLTLGTADVTAIDMAQAYGVFANNGIKMDVHTVERIVDRHGNVIYEHQAKPDQVLSHEAAFLVNDILRDFVRRYLGSRYLNLGRPIAAKTGTTEYWRDVYLVAYTPNLVGSFWMGYDEPKLGSIQQGWSYSTRFMAEVFRTVFEDLEPKNFEIPKGITRVEVCTKSGLLPTDECHQAGTIRTDYFIAEHAPKLQCDMHVVLDICTETGLLANEFCPHVETKAYFDRPPFIVTDGRWTGGAGRGPEDAAESAPDERCYVHTSYTGVISSFKAVPAGSQVQLKWEYQGSKIAGFTITRQAEGKEQSVELGEADRTYIDANVETGTSYIYSIVARFPDGSRSEPAIATVEIDLTVPDVVGKILDEAKRILEEARLRIGQIERKHVHGAENDIVISQNPPAGSKARPNRRVDLVVSQEPPPGGKNGNGDDDDETTDWLGQLMNQLAVGIRQLERWRPSTTP